MATTKPVTRKKTSKKKLFELPPAQQELAAVMEGGLDSLAVTVLKSDTPLQAKYKFMDLCRRSDQEAAQALVQRWDELNQDQRAIVSLDAMARSVEVRPKDVIGAVCAEAHAAGQGTAKMLLGLAQPEVIASMISAALETKGTRDREMFLKTVGFLPAGGGGIHVNATANAEARAAAVVVDDEELPSFESEVLDSDKFQRT